MEALATSRSQCLHPVLPIVLDPRGRILPAACHIPDTCYVAGDDRVLSLMSQNTLLVGDSMARQFLVTCVYLNRRGKAEAPVLDFGGHMGNPFDDWTYELDAPQERGPDNRSSDRLRQLLIPEPLARVESSMLRTFQYCAQNINLTTAVANHGFRPGLIIVFAPVYWHVIGKCGKWSMQQWARDLLARAKSTRPRGFHGLVHLVVPPVGMLQEAESLTRALNTIIRPRWKLGHVYRMVEGSVTWSIKDRAYKNWHTVCSSSKTINGSMHMYSTRDQRCADSANTKLLARMAKDF
jgi:hypothetical protein